MPGGSKARLARRAYKREAARQRAKEIVAAARRNTTLMDQVMESHRLEATGEEGTPLTGLDDIGIGPED